MTKVFFVRHAQPDHNWNDDATRPLTDEGKQDTKQVLAFFKNIVIDAVYSSPYERAVETVRATAEQSGLQIKTDKRFRERTAGKGNNTREMIQKRWTDKDFHEEGGESIRMVQKRNISALEEILYVHSSGNVVVGTHGTALSSILNYYNPAFDFDDFWRIIDWMPYIIELDFEKKQLVKTLEHLYVEKEYTRVNR